MPKKGRGFARCYHDGMTIRDRINLISIAAFIGNEMNAGYSSKCPLYSPKRLIKAHLSRVHENHDQWVGCSF